MPLSDIRVVEVGQAIAGPIVGTFLGDLGADVVKIERPSGDVYRVDRRELNGESFNPPFELYNRNKRSLCIDLTADEGIDAVHRLVEKSDIFIQNWPPGVAKKLNLDYKTLSDINEDLVYTHVTGYGETGPLANNPAFDTIAQHVSGFSSILGYEDDNPPIRAQSSISDFFAGYNATISTLAGLREVENGGGGQKIDVSLLESMMHNMDAAFEYYNNLGEVPNKGGRNAFFQPDLLYGAAEAADGWIVVALLLYSDAIWEGYCEILDRPDLLEHPKYQSDKGRMDDADELTAMFEDWLSDVKSDEAIKKLNRVNIPAAHHNTIPEAAELDQVNHRDIFVDVDHSRFGSLTLTNTPLDLSETEPKIQSGTPALGEHNEEILEELDFSNETIRQMNSHDVIVTND